MTDTSYPVAAITGYRYTPPSLPVSTPVLQQPRHGAPPLDGMQEDDGQISCVCGYIDDDGATVACDTCNKWQHQLCYYPEYEEGALPEDLQHFCVDCHPRAFDGQAARVRQKVKREGQASLVNGVKRQAPKSHKKKVKEPAYANGWPMDKIRHDRNSASPRDQPPPAKRPKTSHRTSDSVTSTSGKGHSRKRNVSSANHRRSLSHSPESSIDLYSDEFMRCYQDDNWRETDSNLFNSIGVNNSLSEWLRAPDDEFRSRHGHDKTEILMRWDGELEDIPGKAQLDIKEYHDTQYTDLENNHPSWKTVSVKESVANGAYIGELKGHVGFKDEYQQDPANRWSLLRHPEPFVFFHPRLPIYIDARNEGTMLRYVRRSCAPNARLQVLITNQTDYRFCFMATEQIDPGVEIAVGWDTTDSLPELTGRYGTLSERDIDHLSSWVSLVLANCGPCACQRSPSECLMSRFDRRMSGPDNEGSHSAKASKSRKRKAAPHISPLNTHLNSRSGSEARKTGPDDDGSESRSTSGSAGRGSASRDITPNTHYSHNGSLSAVPELSERERKKLAKEEEMFRRQEEERSGKGGKKKRNSGSNVNTPSASSSKHFGFGGSSRYTDAGTSKQTGLAPVKTGRRPKGVGAQKTPVKSDHKGIKRPKPEYVNAGVQCELEQEASKQTITLPRRPFISTTQRLLQRCALNNARRRGQATPAEGEQGTPECDRMDTEQNLKPQSSPRQPPSPVISGPHQIPVPEIKSSPGKDTDMFDAPEVIPVPAEHTDTSAVQEENAGPPVHPDDPNNPSMDDSAPPWPSQASHSVPDIAAPQSPSHKPPEMHLQMPPPPANPFGGGTSTLSTGTPASITGSMAQSPASLTASTPMFSPSVTAAVQPSPARKKLSLSDYTKRIRANNKDGEARPSLNERESSPASTASGPIVPPLQPSSSDVNRVGENTSAVEEDVKMEDAAAADTSTSTHSMIPATTA